MGSLNWFFLFFSWQSWLKEIRGQKERLSVIPLAALTAGDWHQLVENKGVGLKPNISVVWWRNPSWKWKINDRYCSSLDVIWETVMFGWTWVFHLGSLLFYINKSDGWFHWFHWFHWFYPPEVDDSPRNSLWGGNRRLPGLRTENSVVARVKPQIRPSFQPTCWL